MMSPRFGVVAIASLAAPLLVFACSDFAESASGEGTDTVDATPGDESSPTADGGDAKQTDAADGATRDVSVDALTFVGCKGAVACERVIFTTSTARLGAFGGAAGADAICTAAANAPGTSDRVRGREFVAWISVAAAAAAARHVHGTGIYVRPDQVDVANDWNALVSGSLLAPLSVDEFGSAVTGSAWTNTKPDGSRVGSGCVDFVSDSAVDIGSGGDVTAFTGMWSEAASYKCNTPRRLICIER